MLGLRPETRPDTLEPPAGSASRRHWAPACGSRVLGFVCLVCLLAAVAGGATEPTPSIAATPAVADAATLFDLWVEEQLAYHGVPSLALAVVADDQVVWSGAWGRADLDQGTPATIETPYRLGSVSKIFTATAVMILRDRGALDLDAPVTQYLPEFRPANPFPDTSITVRHLLTHTAGLPREGAFPYWTTHEFPPWSQFESAAADQALTHPPGEKYHYSNLGMGALGAIVEAVSGMSYAEFVRDEIAVPLGLVGTSAAPSQDLLGKLATPYFRRRADGSRGQHTYYDTGGLAAMGNVVSTVRDLAQFARFLLSDEPAGPHQPLGASTLREMRRPHHVYPSFSGGRGLGFGISRREGKTLVSHGGWIGGHRSHLLLSPDENLAVVAMTNADDASPYPFTYRALDLFAEALAAPAVEAVVPPATWERYYGLYSDPWEWQYRVLSLRTGLVVYEYNYPPLDDPRDNLTPLESRGETDFRMPDGDPFRFELDASGQVVRIQRRTDYIFPVVGGKVQLIDVPTEAVP